MDGLTALNCARLFSMAAGLITSGVMIKEAIRHKKAYEEYVELMRDAQRLRNEANADAVKVRRIRMMLEKKEAGKDRVKLPQMHTARRYGAEYMSRPMRIAYVIPGTRKEECTKLYADDVEVEWESAITVEAELDGELIVVIDKSA